MQVKEGTSPWGGRQRADIFTTLHNKLHLVSMGARTVFFKWSYLYVSKMDIKFYSPISSETLFNVEILYSLVLPNVISSSCYMLIPIILDFFPPKQLEYITFGYQKSCPIQSGQSWNHIHNTNKNRLSRLYWHIFALKHIHIYTYITIIKKKRQLECGRAWEGSREEREEEM